MSEADPQSGMLDHEIELELTCWCDFRVAGSWCLARDTRSLKLDAEHYYRPLHRMLDERLDYQKNERFITGLGVRLQIIEQSWYELQNACLPDEGGTPTGVMPAMGNSLCVALGHHLETGPGFPALYGATWNRNVAFFLNPDGGNKTCLDLADVLSVGLKSKNILPIESISDAGERIPVGLLVIGTDDIDGHFDLLGKADAVLARYGQEGFLFRSYNDWHVEWRRRVDGCGVRVVNIGQWLP